MADEVRATYRLQLNAEQPFARVREFLQYFEALGVSHLYLSPIWQAAPGSTHGYDVLDHAAVSEELGGLTGFVELAVAARDHGLQLIADIVPNHVFVGGASHNWWRDVLRCGRESAFAQYFDIDWSGRPELPEGVLVLPVLGQPFGPCLESGELSIAHRAGELVAAYGELTFPLRAASYAEVFGLPPVASVEADRDAFLRVLGLVQEISRSKPEATDSLIGEFNSVVFGSPAVADWLDKRLAELQGSVGVSASFDALEAILKAQHYRLAHWRVSAEQVNYRRFFDINDLAAVRMEHEPAFRDTHLLVAQLCREGYLSGLRVDHLDGLADPEGYLQSLRALCPGIPIWVEKIVSSEEALPAWPIAGTTGYEFAARVEGLFHEPQGRELIHTYYREFTGETEAYGSISFRTRRWTADRSFDGDTSGIALELHRLARDSRLYADTTLRALREALSGLLAAMPQYRTYIGEEASEADIRVIEQAAREASARDPDIATTAMSFLTDTLTARTASSPGANSIRRRDFVRRVQQVAAPVMAKGVEDTAFFRFTPLISQNEVGNSPGDTPWAAGKLHEWFRRRQKDSPLALNATTTHDTKRSEDARLRVAALTSIPRDWRRELRAWQRMNARRKEQLAEDAHPVPQTEYYLYQTLVAAWDGRGDSDFADRIWEHMLKASREAKLWTSWTSPNQEAEAATEHFVRTILHPRKGARFRARVDRLVESLRPRAEAVSLSELTLKCLAPGVPDFYQGAESWLLTLTDPDNRRPPDFDELVRAGARGPEASPKLWLTKRLLQLRAARPELFAAGAYEPLETASGDEHGFAFARTLGGDKVAVAVSLNYGTEERSISELAGAAGSEVSWDWLTGRKAGGDQQDSSARQWPVAVLTNFRPAPPCE